MSRPVSEWWFQIKGEREHYASYKGDLDGAELWAQRLIREEDRDYRFANRIVEFVLRDAEGKRRPMTYELPA